MTGGAGGGVGGATEQSGNVTALAPDQNAINAVFYVLSTIAQTAAALAAFVGALALYRLQAMREAHGGNERAIRSILTAIVGSSAVSANSPFNAPLTEVATFSAAAR